MGITLASGLFVAGIGLSVAPAHAAPIAHPTSTVDYVFECRQIAHVFGMVATARDKGVAQSDELSLLDANHIFHTVNSTKQNIHIVANAIVNDVYKDNDGKDAKDFYDDVYQRCVNRGVEE